MTFENIIPSRSTSSAAVLGICYMAGYLGGFAGKILGSACLNYTPGDGELGAWWLGWPLIAVGHSCLAFGFILLPFRILKKEPDQGTGFTSFKNSIFNSSLTLIYIP